MTEVSLSEIAHLGVEHVMAVSPGPIYGVAFGRPGLSVTYSLFRRHGMAPEVFRDVVKADLSHWLPVFPAELILIRKERSTGIAAANKRRKSYRYAIEEWAKENAIPFACVWDGFIKKQFTGNGNASALLVYEECLKRQMLPPQTYQEANAAALVSWGMLTCTGKSF